MIPLVLEGPCFHGGRFVRMPYQRSPDREKSIERRKRLAGTQPLRPAMAARANLTTSELAYARLIADDNLIAGDSRDCHDKMAARAGTCSRTIQRAQKHFEKLGWIEVERRPIEGRKHDTNIVRIISPEWLTWIMMGPSPIARQKRRATENQLQDRVQPVTGEGCCMWDHDRDAALVELHSQGHSFAEIGQRLGVTRNAAISHFHWIRGTKFRSEQERKARVAAERECRLKLLREKQQQAVQELRRDLATDMLRRDAILKALESGATCKLIGLELNLSGARVHQLAARAKKIAEISRDRSSPMEAERGLIP